MTKTDARGTADEVWDRVGADRATVRVALESSSSTYVIRIHSRALHIPHASGCPLPTISSFHLLFGKQVIVERVLRLGCSASSNFLHLSVYVLCLHPPPLLSSSTCVLYLLPSLTSFAFLSLRPPHLSFANVIRLPLPMFFSPPRSSTFLPRCCVTCSQHALST